VLDRTRPEVVIGIALDLSLEPKRWFCSVNADHVTYDMDEGTLEGIDMNARTWSVIRRSTASELIRYGFWQ
jgi:hypothetical protein